MSFTSDAPMNQDAIDPATHTLRAIPRSPDFQSVSDLDLQAIEAGLEQTDPRVANGITTSPRDIDPIMNLSDYQRPDEESAKGTPIVAYVQRKWGTGTIFNDGARSAVPFNRDMQDALTRAKSGHTSLRDPDAPIVTVGAPQVSAVGVQASPAVAAAAQKTIDTTRMRIASRTMAQRVMDTCCLVDPDLSLVAGATVLVAAYLYMRSPRGVY